ncbi:kinase D-interacting substrate of 220 kDa B-like isoform X3 [Actinia tenebrosa]|nr:kinase D-interacting substrate of 220 kDa B-like isoform X3 [Actinia tenebrosa]
MSDPFNLVNAIEEGNCSQVLNLLENRGINIEQRDQNGQTPLIIAAEKGNVPIVHEILKRNPDVNAQDDDGWTALIAACKEGHVDVVKELLEHGAEIQISDLGRWTPLVWASYKGHGEIVTDLLGHGADPNEKGQHGMTALIWASGRGHTECVRKLLEAGALADSADKYGTTALVWAARKGHLEVVKALVEKGANINIAGTRGWTALIMAAKGGYTDLVEYLLHRDPNVNATDQEGYSALAWSAKQGHDEIVKKLIAKGAYYNLTDKEGETVLISASRDGHLEVVKTLLSKFAEVDAVDSEGKSALFHAVERGHTAIVKELLEAGAKTEIVNRDGDTPLLRATVKKHTEIVALLLDKGALVCAADRRGDTAVHIAVRGRFRRICELLLRNPKDARLLYRPNRAGETPYNIDRQHRTSILTQIFGTGLVLGGKKCSEEVMGYDVYTSALADVLSEPSLSMPLTVGMYARWGSGKSFVLKRLQEEMREFAHQDMRPVFQFSRFIFLIVLVVSIIFGVTMWAALGIIEGICIGLALFISAYSLFLCAYVADRRYTNGETPCAVGGYVANSVSTLKLLLQFIFCIPPSPRAMKPSLPVRFFFTDFSKLTCSGSEAASLVGMIETLCDVVESEFGFFVSRLYRVFRTPHSEYEDTDYIEARWKRCCCCIPTFIIFLFVIICGLTSLTLFTVNGTKGGSIITGIEIATSAVVGVAVLAHFPTVCSMLYSLAFSQKKRISVVATQLGLKEEGFIHALKQEVELLTDLVNCVDGFTRHQTRIVIVIDGLDNSEQSKVLQLLDSVNLLFTDPEAPFIILMALDPRVMIRAIDQSFSSILRESHISASDYLKSIVQLPFYLPEPKSNYTGVLPPNVMSLLEDVRNVDYDSDHQPDIDLRPSSIVHDDMEWDGEMLQYDNDKRAHRDFNNCNGGVPVRIHPDLNLDSSLIYEPNEREPCLAVDHQKMLEKELELEERRKISADLAQVLADNETVNPLGVKRLMNIVSLTCRLLRARSVEYSWKRLAAWVSLVDGWPYKTSWLVLLIEDNNTHIRDNVCLKDLYEATLSAMPVINEVDCMVDGDPVYFETFLSSHQPLLRAADVRRFLLSTIHLDQSLRRQMVECLHAGLPSGSNAKSETESVGKRSSAYQLTASYIAKEKQINLNSLTIDDVCKQLSELEGLDQKQMSTYQKVVTDNNINGKVLASCDLSELSQIMGMTFGDWQLFRAWIINARYPQECGSRHLGSRCISPGEMQCQLIKTSSSGGWDQGNILGSPKGLSMSEQNEGVQNEPEPSATQLAELKATQKGGEVPVDENGVPQIVLQPPSTPGTEEEDNCETTETELENRDDEDDHHEQAKLRRSAKEKRMSKEEKSYSVVEDKMDNKSQKSGHKKEETLVDIETDEEKDGSSFTPQPPIALFFKEQEDFPTPPDNTDGGSTTLNKGSASHDLMFFSESNGHPKKDQELTRTSYEDDLWIPMEKPRTSSVGSTGSADFPPPPSPPTIQVMECTCEMITPDENREIDKATLENSLFSDAKESNTIGRPSPIVLTMAKNGPVTNAVAVKQSATGDARSTSSSSTRSVSESTGTQSTMFPDRNRSGIPKSYSTDIRYLPTEKSEPIGTRPVSTSDMKNQNIRSLPSLKQRAGSEGWVSPKSGSPPEQHCNVLNSKNNSNNSDINDFPPPPPPLLNDSGKYQPDSPWVPLLQRFQVDQDSAMYMDSEENHRRPRPKPGSTTQDQRSQKFRSYAPHSKPSVVEVNNSEDRKDKKNETCV